MVGFVTEFFYESLIGELIGAVAKPLVLVVTLLNATFGPVGPDPSPGTVDDLSLFSHTRTTILFNVNNPNKLTRIQARSRVYARDQNPADPNGGTLGTISNTQIVYNRIVASDADLLAP